jgi:hypothetical protein
LAHRMPHPTHSSGSPPLGFFLFRMLKNWSQEIQLAIAMRSFLWSVPFPMGSMKKPCQIYFETG